MIKAAKQFGSLFNKIKGNNMKIKCVLIFSSIFIANYSYATPESLELARCVNIAEKASDIMYNVGNSKQGLNFMKMQGGYTMVGENTYGKKLFLSQIKSTKSEVDSMSNETVVAELPACIKLRNEK